MKRTLHAVAKKPVKVDTNERWGAPGTRNGGFASYAMDKFDRIYQLHSILAARRTPIDTETLMARLECGRSTLYRIVGLMKDNLGAPIEFDTDVGGFVYRRTGDETYELPGLWFSQTELQGLAVMQRVLQDFGTGLLGEQVSAISKRLNQLVRHRRLNLGEAAARLRFPPVASKPAGVAFQVAAAATLQRHKLWFEYHSRGSNRKSERAVSPQRLTRYREAWYLDAWDDESDELRTFSIDRMRRARVLDDKSLDVPDPELDAHYASAYGIFGGRADHTAVLRFTSERARWVADECGTRNSVASTCPTVATSYGFRMAMLASS